METLPPTSKARWTRRNCWAILFLLVCLLNLSVGATRANAQEIFFKNGDAWPVVPLSPERTDDAYAIYSLLIPQQFPNTVFQHSPLWLIANITLVIDNNLDDPRTAITPPLPMRAAMAPVLQDFVQHQYEHVQLDKNFNLAQPYRLLNRMQLGSFQRALLTSQAQQVNRMPAPYQDAMGLIYFSDVYFNFEHTLAMVFVADWCGAKCGLIRWVVLKKENGAWNTLPWAVQSRQP